ncbi:AraC family transcriptional regulator [Aquibacillus salsiterrae]|uniref:AraC family transcriptional regulator n=1 Tax=Aquibacillus salsiterrae TaxID=2950439 RepID=A0A9X3WJ78_9BACI|nr:AraC family transcriptional regulator [Aquibacillus salsiterrae]MDC3418354.1 AraC family transcriptional regulator [Aquibacillus salsiterrae]
MEEQLYNQQHALAKLIKCYTVQNKMHETDIPSLFFYNEPNTTEPSYRVFKPSLCVIIQGEKEYTLAQEKFSYSPGDYFVASVDLPITGQVIKAAPDAPYLSLKLEFSPSEILEVLSDADIKVGARKNVKRAISVNKLEASLFDAVVRLANLLDNPKDIPVLSPLFKKEILYRVLKGPHGDALKQMAIKGNNAYLIRGVIEHIIQYYDRSFKMAELAERANMSVASFHRHFKEITSMSPLQFQKQLRLQEARRMLMSESTDAADVAFRVGYESPSQFSREYSRMFGSPPRVDIKQMKENFAKMDKVDEQYS